MQLSTVRLMPPLIGALSCLTACDAPTQVSPIAAPPVEENRAAQPAKVPNVMQRQMAFLNRIRQADPQKVTIDRALLNEQNELGLILDRSVEMDKIPALMRSVMTEMAREFPGQDLTVIAYAPSSPPRKIGTAHLNAQTGDMTYTPENKER